MLSELGIADFRCIRAATLSLHPRLNLVTGPNASGKTSLLEAFYFLGRGRSFRTWQAMVLVRDGADALRVTGRAVASNGLPHRLGVQYGRAGFEVRVDGLRQARLSALAEQLSVAVIDPTVHDLVAGAPEGRRRFVDWGVFHVERGFLEVWRRYQRALRQRNAGLRAGAEDAELAPWTSQLANAGAQIDAARRCYCERLATSVNLRARELAGAEVECVYRAGWAQGQSLAEALERDLRKDRATGSTRSGPHRADLQLRVDGHPAKDWLSRGQGKVVGAALVLAQVALQVELTGNAGVMLLDDPASELDSAFLGRLVEAAMRLEAQLVITGLDAEGLPVDCPHHRFHVKQGEIHQSE